MTAVQREDRWMYDPAHQALEQWVTAWRSLHPGAALPSLGFARHLGTETVALATELGAVELTRHLAAAGYDGTCLCGRPWDEDLREVRTTV